MESKSNHRIAGSEDAEGLCEKEDSVKEEEIDHLVEKPINIVRSPNKKAEPKTRPRTVQSSPF